MSLKKNRRIVIGNWKMNPLTVTEARHIITKTKNVVKKLERTSVVACPPFPFISFAVPKKIKKGSGIKIANMDDLQAGAQNVSFEEQGPFTGEVSARQIADIGAAYVIVGHSERRGTTLGVAGETNGIVSKKAAAVVQAGLIAVLCVGEKSRDAQGEYLDVLREQIKASLQAFPKRALDKLIVAYEPVWAIGSRESLTPALVREMAIFIKKVLSDIYGQDTAVEVPILYGGSVNFRNASDIITIGEVDGLLVGRESVNVPGFTELLKTVDSIK